MYWGLAGSVVLRNQKGYRRHCRAPRVCRELFRGHQGCKGVRDVLGNWQGV